MDDNKIAALMAWAQKLTQIWIYSWLISPDNNENLTQFTGLASNVCEHQFSASTETRIFARCRVKAHLTFFFEITLHNACVLFFCNCCREYSCSASSLGKFCSCLQLEEIVFDVYHSVFAESIKCVVSAIQSNNMRITKHWCWNDKNVRYRNEFLAGVLMIFDIKGDLVSTTSAAITMPQIKNFIIWERIITSEIFNCWTSKNKHARRVARTLEQFRGVFWKTTVH